MDENKLNDKLDKIIEVQSDMKVELAEIRKGYDYHVYRTDLAETAINMNKAATEKGFEKMQEQIEPLKSFKDYVTGGAKLFVVLLSIAGVFLGFIKYFGH